MLTGRFAVGWALACPVPDYGTGLAVSRQPWALRLTIEMQFTRHRVHLQFALSVCLWLLWVFIALCGAVFRPCERELRSALQRMGLSPQRRLVAERRLGARASAAVAHGLSCCEACGMLPEPGIEPAFPLWAGRFLSTVPLGNSPSTAFKK